MTRRPRLLFLVTEDWYFCSHRLPLGLAAREAGFDVAVATRVRDHGEIIRAAGLRLIPLEIAREGTNPLRDLALIARLTALYRRERPDLVHQVAMKPVLYGSLAARLAGVPGVVNALAGLGYLFSSDRLKARLLRPLVRLALGALLGGRRARLIVQNPDDADLLTRMGRLDPAQVALIRGSGVDLTAFASTPEPPGPPVVMLPSRLLWDKGVGEFAEAARILKDRGVTARFVLVGRPDPQNPAAVAETELRRWEAEGVLDLWGHSDAMAETLARAHVVCLPSYREGLPKVLLEAAACARPIVTTDVPGCREVVRDGVNGLLVPPRDAQALAAALIPLIQDPVLRQELGRKAREMAEERFGIESVVAATLAVYRELLARAPTGS